MDWSSFFWGVGATFVASGVFFGWFLERINPFKYM